MRELWNRRVALALHELSQGPGTPLLLLHGLGESAARFRDDTPAWSGPVHALDFSGHGHSGRVLGGGYYPELWAADADAALAALGSAVIVGAGLGAYVALLLAGGRPDQVRAAVLCGGPGLHGGGVAPDFDNPELPDIPTAAAARALQPIPSTDDNVHLGQDIYVRPPDYALPFARRARRLVLLEGDGEPPPWWRATRDATRVARVAGGLPQLPAALAEL